VNPEVVEVGVPPLRQTPGLVEKGLLPVPQVGPTKTFVSEQANVVNFTVKVLFDEPLVEVLVIVHVPVVMSKGWLVLVVVVVVVFELLPQLARKEARPERHNNNRSAANEALRDFITSPFLCGFLRSEPLSFWVLFIRPSSSAQSPRAVSVHNW
jgi:hypothetical protein